MGRFIVVIALIWLAVVSGVSAKGFLHGFGSSQGAPIVACGTGVIDLSTGCTQPMLGGL